VPFALIGRNAALVPRNVVVAAAVRRPFGIWLVSVLSLEAVEIGEGEAIVRNHEVDEFQGRRPLFCIKSLEPAKRVASWPVVKVSTPSLF
jgi:hypothetical protein